MPDRDWYTNHVQRNWRGVARRIEAEAPDERVADLCLRALGKTIREAGGVAGLEEFIGVVRDFARGRLSLPQAFAQLRDICLRIGGSYLTQIAKAGAESTIGAIKRGTLRDDVGAEVRRRFVERALDAYLFAPARSRHVGHGPDSTIAA